MAVLPTGIGPVSAGGYQIERSLRFNSADSAYLNRTPASAGNRKTWTWSCWAKLGTSPLNILSCNSANNDTGNFQLTFTSSAFAVQAWSVNWRVTTQVLRDNSAWYHIIVAVDTTQATANNRIRVYINGTEVTAFSTINNPSQNADIGMNQAATTRIGAASDTLANFFNGYLTEINFIDGQALTPSDFGETDSATGVWKPKKFSGTYGTNGFYLNFSDNSNTTSTTLGKDSSGNGNNWTPNNFSVTAGAGNDSLVDTPTSYGTGSAGGDVRGNYCTLNSVLVAGGYTLANGNLEFTRTGATGGVNDRSQFGTIGVTSGKWYWEFTAGTVNSNSIPGFGIAIGSASTQSWGGGQTGVYIYQSDGLKYLSGTGSSYGAAFTTGDIIGVAFDADAGTLTFYKNNVSQGQAASGLTSGPYFPAVTRAVGGGGSNGTEIANFGQRPFAYAAPSGFKALCTQNLPTPTIGATSTTQANKYFDVSLYTGTGTQQSITGVGFQPDFIWQKIRNQAFNHRLNDAIRGADKDLYSNSTSAEVTQSQGLLSFNSNGFTVGTDNSWNYNTGTYVVWQWNAGGSNATNTSGTITSTVRANTTAGFSIVTYTGNGVNNATVGHGLGAVPNMVIIKRRDVISDWNTKHSSLSSNNVVFLNTTDAQQTPGSGYIGNLTSSTVITLVNGGAAITNVNGSSNTYVAYCFAAVAGYSAFGSYTGNGSSDGPFVYTGFRPRFVMFKRTDTAEGWYIYDTVRTTINVMGAELRAESSAAESDFSSRDFLSNGFKIRTANGSVNASGGTYIFAAFAESPFKYSLAR